MAEHFEAFLKGVWMSIPRTHIGILVVNVIYVLVFALLFSVRKNYEFLIYVGTVAFLVALISYLRLKFNFTTGVLLGLTAWGLLHMLGGYVIIKGRVLYSYQVIPGIVRFDQSVHTFGFGFATLFAYYILKPNLIGKTNWIAVSILLVLIGMGLGALNEIIEFVAVLSVPQTGVGGYENTMWDMVSNTVGGFLAVVYVNLKCAKGDSPENRLILNNRCEGRASKAKD